jgi:CheY-like chemotaxis protein
MSHELRTPLNAVMGFTNLLLRTSLDEQQKEYTQKMSLASTSLLDIINNILDFSDIDVGKMKLRRSVFEFRPMMGNLASSLRQHYTDSNVELRLELDTSIPSSLSGDPLRLKQVLFHLINNAYKFAETGVITIRAVAVRNDPNNVMVEFTVADTGIGMSSKQIQEVFTAFHQGDNSATRRYHGVGIGLTIVREMIELMGGTISVTSEEGKGTVFTFSCPFQIPEDVAVQKQPTVVAIPPDGANDVLCGMRVLLVEDNKINAIIAAELLRSVGIDVTVAGNGAEGLERLAEAAKLRGNKPFDLVLMDLQMPVMDGYEATKIIKNTPEYKDIPIFALTAHAFAEERDRCLDLGMQEHLPKPIDVEKFYEVLRTIAPR